MTLPEGFVFSQSSLGDFRECQRRFELRYLLEARWPALTSQPALDHELAMARGATFHHLVHQHTVGVPAEALSASVAGDEVVSAWWARWLAWQAHHIPEGAVRYAEISLSAPVGDYTLLAKYDMLAVLPDGRVLIYDWKTSRMPPEDRLRAAVQTRAYRFVLAQAGGWLGKNGVLPPDHISMAYWYADSAATIALGCDADTLREDETWLGTLIDDIAATTVFPLTPDTRKCAYCVYRSLCDRGAQAGHFTGEAPELTGTYDADVPFVIDDAALNTLEL
jgi:hypothetical protein